MALSTIDGPSSDRRFRGQGHFPPPLFGGVSWAPRKNLTVEWPIFERPGCLQNHFYRESSTVTERQLTPSTDIVTRIYVSHYRGSFGRKLFSLQCLRLKGNDILHPFAVLGIRSRNRWAAIAIPRSKTWKLAISIHLHPTLMNGNKILYMQDSSLAAVGWKWFKPLV